MEKRYIPYWMQNNAIINMGNDENLTSEELSHKSSVKLYALRQIIKIEKSKSLTKNNHLFFIFLSCDIFSENIKNEKMKNYMIFFPNYVLGFLSNLN